MATATTPTTPTRPNYRRRRIWAAVAAVWVAVAVIAGVALAGHSTAKTGGSGSSDAAFVTANQNSARSAVASIDVLQIEIAEIGMQHAPWRLGKLSRDAANVHANLDAWREHLLTSIDTSNPMQLGFLNAENDLKRAVGALGQWADGGGVGTPVAWDSQLARATAEWDQSARVLWRGAGQPPLLGGATH